MAPRKVTTEPKAKSSASAARIYGGQRVAIAQPPNSSTNNALLATPRPIENWRGYDLDRTALDKLPAEKLIELLCDVSPDISRALFDFLRFCNPGYDARTEPPSAQPKLDALLKTLKDTYGSVDVVINRLYTSAFLRGAFCGELVLGEDNRTFVDLATPDPAWMRFRQTIDPVRGTVWQLGQWLRGKWIPLDMPTIRYLPVDPLPNSPYGRALATPALSSVLFLTALLHDLRRVVEQQGYPRLDIEIDIELLKQQMPTDVLEDGEQASAWVRAAIDAIKAVYVTLEPDDAYVHPSFVKVNRPVGTVDSSSLGAVDGLISMLERSVTRALKSNRLMMGLDEGGSEGQSNRLWEIHAAGVKSMQHAAEALLEYLLSLALQAQGVRAVVGFRFAELRASEMLRDEQTAALRIANASARYTAGWISQDEAAQQGAGKTKADAPAPRAVPAAMPGSAATAQPEPGANRTRAASTRAAATPDSDLSAALESLYRSVNLDGVPTTSEAAVRRYVKKQLNAHGTNVLRGALEAFLTEGITDGLAQGDSSVAYEDTDLADTVENTLDDLLSFGGDLSLLDTTLDDMTTVLWSAVQAETRSTRGLFDTLKSAVDAFVPGRVLARVAAIVTTETTRAVAWGTLAAYRIIGVETITLNTSGEPCEICKPLAGTRGTPSNPPLTLPLHPSCRCRWVKD